MFVISIVFTVLSFKREMFYVFNMLFIVD